MTRALTLALLFFFLLARPALNATAQSFELLAALDGNTGIPQPTDISDDGSVVVGVVGQTPVRWMNGEVTVLPGGDGRALAVSADGLVIVGQISDFTSGYGTATRWDVDPQDPSMITASTINVGFGTIGSSAAAVSADGSVIGGIGIYLAGGFERWQAFRWENGTATPLGFLGGHEFSGVAAMSADGSKLAGQSQQFRHEVVDAFFWDGAMSNIGELEAGAETYSNGMSANGQYIAGNTFSFVHNGFRWSAADGMMAIPFIAGASRMVGADVTNDGAVFGYWANNNVPSDRGSFRWTSDTGTEDLGGILTGAGVDLGGFDLSNLSAVTPDGVTVTGYARSDNTWRAWRAVMAPSTSITVNELGDEADFDTTDEACDTNATIAGNQCTLRAAFQTVNAVTDGSPQTIKFELDGAGPHTIAIGSPLPQLLVKTKVDGASQDGFADQPHVLINGSGAGVGASGISIGAAAAGSTIDALAIDGFDGDGIAAFAIDVTVTRSRIGVGTGSIPAIGIGGHGIYANGVFDNLKIGRDDDVSSGNTIGNSGGNGIFLEGPAGGESTGKSSGSANSGINIGISHNLIGMMKAVGATVPTPAGNALNAMKLQGMRNALIKLNSLGNSGMHGVELLGPLATGNTFEGNDIGGWFMRTESNPPDVTAMGNSLSGIFAHSGANGNLFGILGGRPNTVVANQKYGLRLDNSHNNSILSSLFGVPADSTDSTPGKNGGNQIVNLGNVLGGLCLENSGNNTIEGNVISNNGSEPEHAGTLIKGLLSTSNKLFGNFIGTNRLGHLLGNTGSGILVTEGADETQIGGDAEAQGNVIGANTGNGIYMKGQPLEESIADVAAGKHGATDANGVIAYRPAPRSTASINLGNITNNLIGAFMLDGQPREIGNGLNGMCLLNAFKTLAKHNTFAANNKNGVEVLGPLSTQNVFEGNAMGVLSRDWSAVQSLADVFPAGNGESGALLHSQAFKNSFRSSGLRLQTMMANQQYGLNLISANLNKVHSTNIGMIRNLSQSAAYKSGAELINFGNLLGGICVNNGANNEIGGPGLGNLISNNGTDSTHAGITLIGRLTQGTSILGNLIGTTDDDDPTVGNKGPGIRIDRAIGTTVGGLLGGLLGGSGNRISGNGGNGIQGLLAAGTKIIGNLLGAKADSTTALPNGMDALSFDQTDALEVRKNKMFSLTHKALATVNSRFTEIIDNDLVAHEAVHVLQGRSVTVEGTTVTAPSGTPAPPEASAMKFIDTQDANVGSSRVGSGNVLNLQGGDGLVFSNSKGTTSQTSIEGAETAVSLENSELQLQMMQLHESQRGLHAILNSRFEMSMSVIRNMSGSNSGVHMENSVGVIRGVTITGDAGDAVWTTGSDATITGNNFVGNTGFGVRNVDAARPVDATGNWWGHESGPGGEGPGSGDDVSANVDFSGWLDAEIGLIVSVPDTVVAIPGDSLVVDAAVSNLVNPTDQVDLSVSDTGGWLSSPATATVATQTDPVPFNVALLVPLDAVGGAESTVTIDATSQTTTALTTEATVVVQVATPAAVLGVGSGETGGELQSPSGRARLTVVANTASGATDLSLFNVSTSGSAGGGASGRLGDARSLSPDGSVVKPTSIPTDADGAVAVWAFSANTTGAASGRATGVASGKMGGNAADDGPITVEICLGAADHNLAPDEIDTAVVVHRRHNSHEWRALSSTARDIDGNTHVCASASASFGFATLATGTEAAPSPPVAAFPGRDRAGVASDPTLAWSAAIGAARYEVQLSTDVSFALLLEEQEVTGASHAVSGLAVNTQHYWRLRSGSSLGFGPWSETFSFTTSATGVYVEDELPPTDIPESDGRLVTLVDGYPNPFSNAASILYRVGAAADVTLAVYDALGRRVAVLAEGVTPAGDHKVRFQPVGLASGIYLLRVTARPQSGDRPRGTGDGAGQVDTRTLVYVR